MLSSGQLLKNLSQLKPVRSQPLHAVVEQFRNRQFWFILVVLTALTQYIAESRLVDGLRGAGLDTAMLFGSTPRALKDVVVIEIDDESYQSLFQHRTPLDRDVLTRLIQTVVSAGPAVIGFDLELTHPLQLQPAAGSSNASVPLVWSTGIRVDADGVNYTKAFEGSLYGVALLHRGRDGVVRRYGKTTVLNGRPELTLVSAVMREACMRHPDRWDGCSEQVEEPSLIRYARSVDAVARLPAWSVLEVGKTKHWQAGDLLRDKIVLIGGTWTEARDMHVTPMGDQPGVYVQVQSIATALDGGGLQEPGHFTLFLAKLVAGIVVGVLAAILSSRWSVFLHLVIVPGAALCAAAVAVTANYWIDFVPVLMSGFIHQWYHDMSAPEHVVVEDRGK